MTSSTFRGMAWRGRAWFLPLMALLFLVAMLMWSSGLREIAPITLVGSLIPVGLCFYWRQKKSQVIHPHEREKILENLVGDWKIELVYQKLVHQREEKKGGIVVRCCDIVNCRKSGSTTCQSAPRFTGPFMEKKWISRKISLKRRVCRNGSLILDTLGSIVKVGEWDKNHLYFFGTGTIHIDWSKEEDKLWMLLSDLQLSDLQEEEKCRHVNKKKDKSTYVPNGENESDVTDVLNWKRKGEVRIKLKQEGAEPEVLMINLSNQRELSRAHFTESSMINTLHSKV